MSIDATYLEMSFDNVGIRDSQKRLKQLITDLAVEPLKEHQQDLLHRMSLVEDVVARRVALVMIHWLQHKHNPITPSSRTMMSDITNANKHDMTLHEFYTTQVKDAMYQLAPLLGLEMPYPYTVDTEELEYALIELEERMEHEAESEAASEAEAYIYDYMGEYVDAEYDPDDEYYAQYDDYDDYEAYDEDFGADEAEPAAFDMNSIPGLDDDDADLSALEGLGDEMEGFSTLAEFADESHANGNHSAAQAQSQRQAQAQSQPAARRDDTRQRDNAPANPDEESMDEKSIVLQGERGVEQSAPPEVDINVLNLGAEQAWRLTYELMGYQSDYIQQQMLPRWQQKPGTFEKDRRFLYNAFIDALKQRAASQMIAGHFRFADRPMTVDDLWNHYYADLSKNVAPQLAAAQLEAAVNTPWHRRLWDTFREQMKNLSIAWLAALAIALIFDGLTTYVSLDQTPMDGPMVMVFTVLITALFQIADLLVINYRKREFDAEAMSAKYQAQFKKITQMLQGLDATSDSFVQLSMQKSQAHANWKAAEDSRRMARRGGFWSGRIADINIIVTAYGFAYMFLNASEPMYALFQQITVIRNGAWEQLNLWVFLMVGLAITVSFVINTAQRTEILGWSLRALKNEA